MMSREEVYAKISAYLVEMFEVPVEDISLKARLSEDLDLDSIDAVDLIVKLQEISGKRIQPEEFKNVRTIEDVVDAVCAMMVK